MKNLVRPIERLLNLLDALSRNSELLENPGFDLQRAMPILDVSQATVQQLEDIDQLVLQECFGEFNNVLHSQLEVLRHRGYPVDVGADHDGLGRKTLIIYTIKGAIEI